MPNGTCGVITFGVKGGRDACVKMMDSLKMIAIVTHVADARSCVLHPASHTHRQMNDEQLKEAGDNGDELAEIAVYEKMRQNFLAQGYNEEDFKYLCDLVGIKYAIQEESYTSQTMHHIHHLQSYY